MDDLRRRMKRLKKSQNKDIGVWKKPIFAEGQNIEKFLHGQVVETEVGECFLVRQSYPADTVHGGIRIGDWLTLNPATLAAVGNVERMADIDPRDYLFLDTETSGLGGGAFAFQIGIGYFDESDNFIIDQFFLRDPSEEKAMLTLLDAHLTADRALVTFNGRSFDVPLLEGRYIRNRMRSGIGRLPNLDLLTPARRLWKRRLASCALGALEIDILDLSRTHADVPGYLIPALYTQYLRTGDAEQISRVFYHNEQDLLSMVSLGLILCRQFESPEGADIPPEDRFSLARWFERLGLVARAESIYRLAIDEAEGKMLLADGLRALALMLKRADRRPEAESLWLRLSEFGDDPLPHEELAKFHEWHSKRLDDALQWTESGIRIIEAWRTGHKQKETTEAFTHRRERLLRKLAGRAGPGDEGEK